MRRQKLNWTLMLLLVPILILGLTACGGQSESEAPPAATAEEKGAEAPAQTEETTATAEGPEEAIEVREATTVMAATQMIDLHDLPLPDGAELMGQPEPGSLRYQAPIEVDAAVDLYRTALTDQGWQEDVEAGHIDKASASLFFMKEDFKLSLSVGMGEDTTMVSLTNHGNIDLRALPQMADAEDVYYFPSSLGYFSPTDVTTVADFTRRELAAQGWHEYTRPHTAMADDPERQSFTLIQNGLELSVSVGVAPAQGGKTGVQYSVSLLPLDLPVPDDAAGLELEKMPLNLSLSYTTSADFETLFDYYSQEMTALGWVVIDSIGMMTPERATLFFGNENVPPHTLVLDLIPSDGQTLATLRNYEADEITELNTPGTSSPAEETPQTTGGEIPAIPIPDEAQDVAYDADLGEITYTTLSDAETVADFYRQSLSAEGWQVDEASVIANDVGVIMTFEQGEESIDFRIMDVSAPTRVTVNIRYAPSLVATTGGAATAIEANVGDTIEMGDLSFAVTEVTSPEEINYSPPFEGNKFIVLVFIIENRHTSDTLDAYYLSLSDLSINDYDGNSYQAYSLALREVDNPDVQHNGQIAPGEQMRGEVEFQVPVEAEDLVFVIDMASLGVGKASIALPETETPPMAGSTGGEIPDFLIPADAQDVVYDADFGDITYTSPSDVETVVEFYRQSLLAEGWQEDEASSAVDENFAFVQFDQGEDTLYIDITFIDTGITEVTIDMSFASSLVATIEGKTSTGTETTPSDSGPLSLVEEEGFPVPSDYANLGTMDTPFASMVFFSSPSDVDTLVELYETELPGQGWEFSEHSLDGDVARLYFESDDQKLSIDLRVNDGEISPELAGQTSVELSIKDPAAAAEAEILPPPGQARIMLMNGAEVELTATVNQQEFKLTPIPMSTEFPKDAPSIDLPPGQYTLTISMPDGTVVNEDFEVGSDKEIAPDEVWAFILDADGMPPMQWPVY